jgi:hypothetical protein
LLIFISVIWLLFIVAAIYLFKLRKMSLYEFIAYVLVLLGGSTMVLMGKTMFGYIGVGVFSIGLILQIMSKIKGINERK